MPETKETIGQRLKQIRLSRQISIEKAAEATRVRVIYLQALEADNYFVMSSAAQSRGFLRLYADFLGLNLEAAMSDLQQVETVADVPPSTPASAPVTLPPAPVAGPQTPPASPADGKPVRRAFWARLLRRPVPATSPQGEPAPEVESVPAAAPVAVVAPESVIVPEPEPAPARVKKSTTTSSSKGKKARTPATVEPKSKPRSAAKTTAKTPDKKKASLKSQPPKNRR
jgi:transcriptional regulator with XRE-family HTH domain